MVLINSGGHMVSFLVIDLELLIDSYAELLRDVFSNAHNSLLFCRHPGIFSRAATSLVNSFTPARPASARYF